MVCSVHGCHSTEQIKQTIDCKYSFYRFPRDNKLCHEWIKRCLCPKINKEYARICSRHFMPSDFRAARSISSGNKVSLSLKQGAIPTLNLPNSLAMDSKNVSGPPISYDKELQSLRPELQNKIKPASVSIRSIVIANQNIRASQPHTAGMFTQGHYVMATPTISNTTAGKISMVPPTINLTFKPQQFLYNKAPNQAAGTIQTQMANSSMSITNSTAPHTPGMPIKVLLVNRISQNINQAKNNIQQTQSIKPNDAIRHTPTTPQVITTPVVKSSTPLLTQPKKPVLKRPAEDVRKTSGKSSKSNLAGFRTLLHQIAQAEQENLKINRQRLELEKQRLEFEKSMAEKFFAILPNMQLNHNNPNTDSCTTGDMKSNGIFCLSPKKEIEDGGS